MPVPPRSPAQPVTETLRQVHVPVPEATGSTELVFDEADAIVSKRTDVRDAHDRYSDDTTDLPHKP